MAKDKPVQGSDFEREDWKDAVYPVRLIKSEEIDNRYFHAEPYVDNHGNERRADDPVERTQFKLTFEVMSGEKKGDWLWAFSPHQFGTKADGTLWGTRAKIAKAMFPDWNPEDGIESDNSDLLGGILNAVITPKADPQYAKVVAWLPMMEEDKKRHLEVEVEAETATLKDEWKALVTAYQANDTKAAVMEALGNPKSAAKAFEAFEVMGVKERDALKDIASPFKVEAFSDDIPF